MNRREMPRDVTILGAGQSCDSYRLPPFTNIKMALLYVFYIIPWELYYHYTIHGRRCEMCLSAL